MAGSVKVTLCLGSEKNSAISSEQGKLSEQLISVKEASMAILKEYITRHNVPNDVPDEPLDEGSSEDDEEISDNIKVQSKKTKRI